jgi:hypothetical protein
VPSPAPAVARGASFFVAFVLPHLRSPFKFLNF